MSSASAIASQVARSAPRTTDSRSAEDKNLLLFISIAPLSFVLALAAVVFFG